MLDLDTGEWTPLIFFCKLCFVCMDRYSRSSSALLLLLTREGDAYQGLRASS
jgi:hypothetical protein